MTSLSRACNLDGVITPEHEAVVPVLDRGFLFGDSVYEVMRTRRGVPFAWREHLARLRASAAGLALPVELDDAAIMQRVRATLAAAANAESYIRIIVTRGTGTAPNIDVAYAEGPARYVILVRPLSAPPAPTARLALIPRLRTDRRALDPAIKSGNYLNNVLGLMEAKAAGATDCLFLNGAGQATEASTSNFYAVSKGRIATPPLSAGLLRGITRALLFEFCANAGFPLTERQLSETEVRAADEMFLSSTLRDVLPVSSLDGIQVRNGAPGPVTREVMQGFEAFCERKVADDDGPALARLLA
jgi:branched-chain amino acid aminotransferase